MSNILKEPVYRNTGIFACLSFMQALQLLIIAAVLASFVPFHKTDFVSKIFPVYLPEVRPEREMFLFRLFVFLSVGIMTGWVLRHKERIDDDGIWKKFLPYLVFTISCVFIQTFFVFKILVCGGPLWAKVMMYVSIVASIFGHVFWPELQRFLTRSFQGIVMGKDSGSPLLADLAFILLLIILLYPYNLDNVLGRMFVQDQFYHLDSMVMAPGWAHIKHLVLDMDIISEYSVGLPVVIADLLRALGHFDYRGAVTFLICVNIAYYAGLYFFIIFWLRSKAWGVFGVLLAVKLQMFHWGVVPLVWQFPSATALRHWPDIFFFLFIWGHIRTLKRRWLLAACVTTGLSLFWIIDVGVYMLAALCVVVLLTRWRRFFIVTPTALLTAFVLLLIVQPQAVFSGDFWRHHMEFASLFIQGWGALPMTEGLKDKQFFAFIMGFLIPVVYVGNLAYGALRYWMDKEDRAYLFMVIISVYGLGLYHYFIHRSGVTSYYAVCIPLVLIICFWTKRALEALPVTWQRFSSIITAGMMVPILMTSYLFSFYPNIFNLGGVNWSVEANYYQQHFDFPVDARLIRELTGPKERVAIISSFETKILMQADRSPFFYYTPLVESSLMDDTKARLTYLHTYGRIKQTVEEINRQRPAYIFIEKKMLAQQNQKALTLLLDTVLKQYVPYKQGYYLIAYKRTGT